MMNRINCCIFACCLAAIAAPASAAEIVGQIAAVSGKEVGIIVAGKLTPQPGDAFAVVVDVPGVGEARVGEGKVNSLDAGIVLGTVTAATGELAIGQKVKINSPQAVAAPPVQPASTMPAAQPANTDAAGRTAALGLVVRSVDQTTAELLELPSAQGCVVTQIVAGSPADTAGVKKRDVVRSAAGAPIADAAALEATLAAVTTPTLKLELWRAGALEVVEITLPPGHAGAGGAAAAATGTATGAVWIGLQVANFRDDVRVVAIIPGSPAARAGFHREDRLVRLDGAEVREMAEFVKEMSGTPAGKSRRVEILRGEQPLTIELMPEPRPTNEQLFARMKKLAEAGDHDGEYQLGLMLSGGQGIPEPDLKAAAEMFQRAAEGGQLHAQLAYGSVLLNGKGVAKNERLGIQWIRKSADQGDPEAMVVLGRVYANGSSVAKDDAESRRWYEQALESGIVAAMVDVGILHRKGIVFEKDLTKSAELCHQAALRGSITGQFQWGFSLRYGHGAPKNPATAFTWLQKAADAGNADAEMELGMMYYSGDGIAQDREAAVKLFQKAAAQQHMEATYNLGICYKTGSGVAEDQVEATRWFHAAAELGAVQAFDQLGNQYMSGRGCRQSDEKAVEYFRKGAEAGDPTAQFNLSFMYIKGRGVEQSYEKATEWALKASEKNVAEAQFYLGVVAMEGLGVEADQKTAFDWFMLAAQQGHAVAQNNVGNYYEYGKGVAANRAEAVRWYERAADQGQKDAIEALKRLGLR